MPEMSFRQPGDACLQPLISVPLGTSGHEMRCQISIWTPAAGRAAHSPHSWRPRDSWPKAGQRAD